jgi:hypothetical protein
MRPTSREGLKRVVGNGDSGGGGECTAIKKNMGREVGVVQVS